MKKIGIWIDSKNAQLISFKGLVPHIENILSGVEDFHPKGGSRSRVAYGPMDKMNEKRYDERKEHQFIHFYNEIISRLKDIDQVYIFGPAQAKIGLEKALRKDSSFNGKIISVEPADSMTINQKVAQVRSVFKID